MLSRLDVSKQRSTAIKHMVLCCECAVLALVAIVWFALLPKIQAAENTLANHQVSAAPTKIQPKLVASYGKLPLSFEANQGQTDARVRFLARGGGYTIFLTDDEAVLTLRKSSVVRVAPPPLFGAAALPDLLSLSMPKEKLENEVQKPRDRRAGPALPFSSRLADSGESSAVLRMRLVGANANAAVTGAEELPGKSNYFIGNDPKKWRTNVPSYARVKYERVYPGVDLVYYGNQGGQLEYDFVVAPGADPNQIKLSFAGADGMRVDAASGDLVLKLGDDEVRFHKPAVYQPAVAAMSSSPSPSAAQAPGSDARYSSLVTGHSSFVLASNNEVAFRVAGYDPQRALVIDPVLSYSTYLGGSGNDGGSGIAVDSSGNTYVSGWTASTDFPSASPLQASNPGTNVFVAKLNSLGTALVYSTYLGGGGDYGEGIAVDSSCNAYVTGVTYSGDFPTVNPPQATYGGGGDAFVAKISPSVGLSPTRLTFSPQNVGATSAPQTETVTNNAAVNLTISTITMGGTNASDFATSTDTCTGVAVTSNGTCTVSVTFTPSATGSRNASLNFIDSAVGGPQSVSLSGTGIDTITPAISISANPATLWPPNGKSVPVTVSGAITDSGSGVNPGTLACKVVDEYGLVQPACPVGSLGAGGAYSFTVSLVASREGNDKNGRTYTITVSASDYAGNRASISTTVIVPHDQGN